MPNNSGYTGVQQPGDGAGDFGAQSFLIRQILSRVNTSTLVKVVSVTNAGGLSAVGFVDVQPLVNQVDGANNSAPQGILRKLPYFRIQGGTDAIIIDPKVGDIGIAVFASRDISTVKNTKKQANPGSGAQFSMSDGLYLGGVLNGVPAQYVQFTPTGINVVSPTKVTITAPGITLNGPVTVNGSVSATGTVTAPNVVGTTNVTFGGKSGVGHTHGGVQTGSGNTGAPT